jgi:hypothetical protein
VHAVVHGQQRQFPISAPKAQGFLGGETTGGSQIAGGENDAVQVAHLLGPATRAVQVD